jgi:hypothetical protein
VQYYFFLFAGSQKVSDVVAFTLTLFSQLVQQVIDHIQDSVFNISFRSFASPATITSSSHELNLTALSAGASNIKVPPDGINVSQQPSDQSCTGESVVALVNGCADDENGGQEAKAVIKKKKCRRLQRLRKRGRRRRRRLNSSEDSDLSDGNFWFLL